MFKRILRCFGRLLGKVRRSKPKEAPDRSTEKTQPINVSIFLAQVIVDAAMAFRSTLYPGSRWSSGGIATAGVPAMTTEVLARGQICSVEAESSTGAKLPLHFRFQLRYEGSLLICEVRALSPASFPLLPRMAGAVQAAIQVADLDCVACAHLGA